MEWLKYFFRDFIADIIEFYNAKHKFSYTYIPEPLIQEGKEKFEFKIDGLAYHMLRELNWHFDKQIYQRSLGRWQHFMCLLKPMNG